MAACSWPARPSPPTTRDTSNAMRLSTRARTCSWSKPWTRPGTPPIARRSCVARARTDPPGDAMKLPVMPLRVKILMGLLIVVTTAVSVITFTMARLFHADKAVYVSDLAAAVAMQAARECDVTAAAYRDRLSGCASFVDEPGVPPDVRRGVVQRMLTGMPGVLAV